MPLYRFRCIDCSTEVEVVTSDYYDDGDVVSVVDEGSGLEPCDCGGGAWEKVFSGAHARTANQWSH